MWKQTIGFLLTIIMVSFSSNSSLAQRNNTVIRADTAKTIMQRYGHAWRGNKELALSRPIILAFRISGNQGGNYHLKLSNEPRPQLQEGISEDWDIGFETDIEFLRRLDKNEISALTAMGQARDSDPTPLVPKFGPAFKDRPDAGLLFRRIAFHFWNRTWPEIIPFAETASRLVHGGNASVFIYDEKIRTAWYQLKPGMHINKDAHDQTNNFPQLVIVTKGEFKGRLDGEIIIMSEGKAVFIPPGMRHEFWAEGKDSGEVIWLAFGEGA